MTGITGSVPARTDIDLTDPVFSNQQRATAAAMKSAMAADQVVLSLAHNMAQPSQITAALLDVLTEFMHDQDITPKQGQARFADAAAAAR